MWNTWKISTVSDVLAFCHSQRVLANMRYTVQRCRQNSFHDARQGQQHLLSRRLAVRFAMKLCLGCGQVLHRCQLYAVAARTAINAQSTLQPLQ